MKPRAGNFNVHFVTAKNRHCLKKKPKKGLLKRDALGTAANKGDPVIGGLEFNSVPRLSIWDTISENKTTKLKVVFLAADDAAE